MQEIIKILEDVSRYAKRDFKRFSAIVAVFFSCGIWITKSMWYSYMSGKLSIYNIDRCYISYDSDSIFLQIIQILSVLVVWFIISYIYYYIATTDDYSKFHWKRKLKKLLFWIFESIIIFWILMVMSNVSLWNLVDEINVSNGLSLGVSVFLLCLIINIYGIEFAIENRVIKKGKQKEGILEEKEENKEVKNEWLVIMSVLIIATVAVELVVFYFIGIRNEQNRRNYKIIACESEIDIESKYCFHYEEPESNIQIYPIVYENQSYYIVSRLYRKGGEVKIDYNYQKIISKEDVETMSISNIVNAS